MNISQIKSKFKNDNYICIGACHMDNILQLEKKYRFYRTNPIKSNQQLGGVASNIANNIRIFSNKIILYSLPLTNKYSNKIYNKKIKFEKILDVTNDSFYTAIIDYKGKLILGLASNKIYENINKIDFNKINKNLNNNTKIILDLCFNKNLVHKIIKYYYNKKIKIYIAGTSLYKIYRIRNSLKLISALCLNEDEVFMLTNKKTINESIKYILNKNKEINLVITRGKKSAIMILNQIKYEGIIPKINIKNENGAGDAFSSMFFLTLNKEFDPSSILSLSITSGCLKAMDFKYDNMLNYNKCFQNILKKVKIKKYDKKIY